MTTAIDALDRKNEQYLASEKRVMRLFSSNANDFSDYSINISTETD